MKFMSTAIFLRFIAIVAASCRTMRSLFYPSYTGASVTAEIMSVHFQSRRERRKEKEEGEKGEEKRESRDNGRGGVAGMRTRMGMGGR